MTMLLRCHGTSLLLLRRGTTYQNVIIQLVHRRIGYVMRGEWHILYESTLKEQQMQNEMDAIALLNQTYPESRSEHSSKLAT